MAEEHYSFAQARLRLEDIVSQVRRKDVSLEKSLDLLEEGVRLANQCTELIDHADWEAASSPAAEQEVDNADRDYGDDDASRSGAEAEAGSSEAEADE